jgi:phytoene synthase
VSSSSSEDLVRLSKSIIQTGSKSFAAAARLFDRDTRADAYLLYAWCRYCDDVIDGQELGFRLAPAPAHMSQDRLTKLRQLTADAISGKPVSDPIFAAFQQVVMKHEIPRQYPFELLDGFAMDMAGRNYATIEDTLTYCYHVAGVVGLMMALVMGVRDEATLDRACDLGLAFQLTNIARDVVEDARVGRIYLPDRWLDEAGIPREKLLDPERRQALHNVALRLLALADDFYGLASAGIARLPLRSRWAIATARNVYREIGHEVRRRGPAAWDSRVATSRSQKLAAAVTGGGSALAAVLTKQPSNPFSRARLWTRPR